MPPAGPPVMPTVDTFGQVAILLGTTVFQFDHDHPHRNSRCVSCREPIGAQDTTVIGAAGLEYPECDHGCLLASVFLIHAHHLPLSTDEFEAAIRYGIECVTNH